MKRSPKIYSKNKSPKDTKVGTNSLIYYNEIPSIIFKTEKTDFKERNKKLDLINRRIKIQHINFIIHNVEKIVKKKLNKDLKIRLWQEVKVNTNKNFNKQLYNMKIITFLRKYSQNLDHIKENIPKKANIIKKFKRIKKNSMNNYYEITKRKRKNKPFNHDAVLKLHKEIFLNKGLMKFFNLSLKNLIKKRYQNSILNKNHLEKLSKNYEEEYLTLYEMHENNFFTYFEL